VCNSIEEQEKDKHHVLPANSQSRHHHHVCKLCQKKEGEKREEKGKDMFLW